MMAFWMEFLRNLKGKWFYLSAVITVCTLWAGLGTDSYWLLQGAESESSWLLETAFTSKMNSIALPLLASLPCAAEAHKEIGSGAVRNILFRSGICGYLFSRVIILLLISSLSQLFGTAAFILLLSYFTIDIAFPINLILARLICTMLFALLGSFGALLIKDTICAYAVPVTMCFALSMLRARFMVEAEFLDPLCWLKGNEETLLPMCGLLVFSMIGYAAFLYREVKRNV